MENDMLQCKYLFLKTVADACHILSGWQNMYGNNNTRLIEANDSVAFATMGTEDTKGSKKKKTHATNARKLVIVLMNVKKMMKL